MKTKYIPQKKTEAVSKLLNLCRAAGYNRIAICMLHPKVKASVGFPFGGDGSLFAHPERHEDHWPTIWRIAKTLGYKTGCGNGQQIQIGHAALEPQTWEIQKKKNNRWIRIA